MKKQLIALTLVSITLCSTTQAMQRARTVLIPAAAAAANAYQTRTARAAIAAPDTQQSTGQRTVNQRALQTHALPPRQATPSRYQQLLGWANSFSFGINNGGNYGNNSKHWQSMVGTINGACAYNYLFQPRQAYAQTPEEDPLFAPFRDPEAITIESVYKLTDQQIKQLLEDKEIAQNIINFAAENVTEMDILSLIMKHSSQTILDRMLGRGSHAARLFTQAAAENITKMKWGPLSMILFYNPKAAKTLMQPAVENITKMDRGALKIIMQYNSESVPVFFQAATQNITKIKRETLSDIMSNYPEAAKIFTESAAENIAEMHHSILKEIIWRNPKAAKAFIQPAAQNITEMHHSILKEIIERNPEAAKAFTQPAAQNITKIDSFVLKKIMELNPDAAELFTQHAADHITEMDSFVLLDIMHSNTKAAKVFTQAAAPNISKIVYLTLNWIMQLNPEAARTFTQPAAENITKIDSRVLVEIMELNPEAAQAFAQAIIQNIKDVPASIIYTVLKELISKKDTSSLTTIQKALKQTIQSNHDSSFNARLKRIIYLKYFGDKTTYNSLSQTEQHILANLDAVLEFINTNKIPSAFIEQLFEQMTKIESDLRRQGYYTFVHGQRWQYRLAEQWYTKLWSLRNNKPVDDYLFAHVKQQPDQTAIKQEKATRKQLVKDGRSDGSTRQKLLFMNYALFGNAGNPGSNSTYYMAHNHNAGAVAITLKEVFDYHGYQDIYIKYEQELTQFEEEHKQLSKYGNMLLIGVPRDNLDECVYLARVSGAKRAIEIEGIGETDDINVIMDTLRSNPEKISDSDALEFCMAMTWDMALNPESGIKIFSLNAADQEKLAAFNEKSEALFARIKRDICGDNAVETPFTPIEEISLAFGL